MAAPRLSRELAEEAVSALDAKHGNYTHAAEALGISRGAMEGRIRTAKLYGIEPKPRPVITHTTTLYRGEEGDPHILQWVKEDHKTIAQRVAKEAFLDALKEVKGLAKPVKAPAHSFEDVLSAIVIGDAHFGMRAFKEETGEADFDLKIAEQELKAAVSYLVQTAPKAKQGMLVDVGDFMHVDNRKQQTPNGGNLLDVDTRYNKLCRVVVMTLRYCISQMLRKFNHVKVVCSPGNHNPDSAGWMALALSMYYENEPRVEIDTGQGAFFYHRFGKNLIGITHGDKVKLADLMEIMAADRPKEWGDTEHRYFWTGHVHHEKVMELRGGVTESFNTLAPGDAWHASSGYRSRRQMQRIDLHKQHGIMSRGFVNLGMLNLA
jgi:hypothetical protein